MMTSNLNVEDIASGAEEDVNNLTNQIRRLLKTMEVAGNLSSVPVLELSKGEGVNGGEAMEVDEGMTPLDVMELCIRENSMKYKVLEESVFFVPVVDKCLIGMDLRNVSNKKLKPPSISLRLSSKLEGQPANHKMFLYTTKVRGKEVNLEKVKMKTSSSVPSDCFGGAELQFVAPGCEVQVTANFPCSPQFFKNGQDDFNLLISAFCEGQHLWDKQVNVNGIQFGAGAIDLTLKNHQSAILSALGEYQQSFEMERNLSKDRKSLDKAMEKFLKVFGFECVSSEPTGLDTTAQIYRSSQSSIFWGSFFKIETCSRRPNVIRCLVSTRTKEQMHLLYNQFQSWVQKQVERERRNDTGSGPKIKAIKPLSNATVVGRIESEVDLLLSLQHAKTFLNKERLSGRSQSQSKNSQGNIDYNWIEQYSNCLTKTDGIFIENMRK